MLTKQEGVSSEAVLLLKIRESVGMDRRALAKAINVSPGAVKAFELDSKSKPPLSVMERALALLGPEVPDELKVLSKPIVERVERRNQMRLDCLNKAFREFVEEPSSQARSRMHDAVYLYYLNSQKSHKKPNERVV